MPHVTRAALMLLAALLLVPALADAKPRGKKARLAADIDYKLVEIMHLRDRGDLVQAVESAQELVRTHPDSISAHRLYQELAVLSRRNGRLIEAEYRHYLAQAPDDSRRKLLHASATMAATVVTPSMRREEVVREIERGLAAAQGNKDLKADAHMVSADLAHLKGDRPAVEENLRASVDAARTNYLVRADLLAFLASEKKWDEAVEICLDLIDEAPWRLMACAMLMPQKAGMPGASPEDQDRIAIALEKVEEDFSDDAVVLQSLEWLYDYLEEKRGSTRLRNRLAELDPEWSPPLRRNPYLEALPGGELTEQEIELLEKVTEIKEQTTGDAWARVRALQQLGAQITEEDPARYRSLYYRDLAFALRHPEVLDRDASRAAARAAMVAMPEDASVLNEWAYMSAMDKVDLPEALEAIDKALELLLGVPFEPISLEPGGTFSDYEIDRAESIGAYVDTRGWVLYQLDRHEEAVRDLYMASLLTSDGTVQGHLGRARYAVGNDRGAFTHLLRAMALGTEDEEAVRALAAHLYEKLHVVPGGLEALVEATRDQLREELGLAGDLFDLESMLDIGGPGAPNIDQSTVPSRAEHRLMGMPSPDFTFESLTGNEFSKESLRGQVVVIDFWATWCAPCVEALPVMDSLARAFSEEEVVFLAMSLDDDIGTVQRWWKFADALNPGMAASGAADAFGVVGIPATFILDRNGIVSGFHTGFDPSMLATITEELVTLLDAE
ncbi:MAG: redoxin domain-containing protein [Proteobacteria bacterium]|nr:redoxin domain-containing protein [Pseudomonadota bacterium]